MVTNRLFLSGMAFILSIIYAGYRWFVVHSVTLLEIILLLGLASLVYTSYIALHNMYKRKEYIERVEEGADEPEVIHL